MKTQIFKITMAVLCTLIVSCNDTMEELNLDNSVKNNVEYHGVPLEEALAHLDGFLASLEEPTRSGSTRRVGSVNVVRSRDVATRSVASAAENVDSLIYVVNFEDNQGFAYLAADDRISEPVIYVSDSGSISTNGLGDPISIGNQRPIYWDYPLNGPETFYDDELSPGELFMNPNTFTLYLEEEDDYLVGDFYLDGMAEYEDMLSQINQHVLNYVENELNQQESIYQEIIYNENPNTSEPALILKTTSTIDTVVNVYKLLEKTYSWSQGSPFNNHCPLVTNRKTGIKENAAAGCVALATAKIMAYNQYPETFNIGYLTILWNSLLNNYNSPLGAASASALTKHIRDNCFTIYFTAGTFSLPTDIVRYLRNRGYSNVRYANYNDEDVKRMLDNNHPIFICSVPAYSNILEQLENSHAWNIDGYLMKTTTYITETYQNDILLRTTERKENSFMVHCDWGWGGTLNGYFTSGVFDLSDSNVLYDNEKHSGYRSHNYKWYKKIITYDIPH